MGAQLAQPGRVGDPLAGRRVREVGRQQAALAEPLGSQERRPDPGHPRAVRVGLVVTRDPARWARSTRLSTRSACRSVVLSTWQ